MNIDIMHCHNACHNITNYSQGPLPYMACVCLVEVARYCKIKIPISPSLEKIMKNKLCLVTCYPSMLQIQ